MIYRFDGFALDGDRRELTRASRAVDVEPQVFDLLLYLIRNRHRVVTRDELTAEIWQRRHISASTIGSRISAARLAIGDNGDAQRLVRTVARKGLRFVGDVREVRVSPRKTGIIGQDVSLGCAVRPATITVLPFATGQCERETQDVADALSEEIAGALAQCHWISVIGGVRFGSTSPLLDMPGSKQAAYVIEGSVRGSSDRLRVSIRLLDTTTGIHLWARLFEAKPKERFDLQDQIVATLVAAVETKLQQIEAERERLGQSDPLDARSCYMRGLGQLYKWTDEGIRNAMKLFRTAIDARPDFAAAYGMAAYCHIQRKSYGWVDDRSRESAECITLAIQAAELGNGDAGALAKAAHALASVSGDLDGGAVFAEQALQTNPKNAEVWYASGWIKLFDGAPDAALEQLTRAIRLNPSDARVFKIYGASAYAHMLAGRYDEACDLAERALRMRPGYLTAARAAAASHALAGRRERALALMSVIRRQDPKLRLRDLPNLLPFRRGEHSRRWSEGMQKAGLPG